MFEFAHYLNFHFLCHASNNCADSTAESGELSGSRMFYNQSCCFDISNSAIFYPSAWSGGEQADLL